MSPNVHRPSATIYQFPAGGRANDELRERGLASVTQIQAVLPKVVVDHCWYHDDAIEEEAPAARRGGSRLND